MRHLDFHLASQYEMNNKHISKPGKTKAQIREELSREIDSYLSKGGEVKNIPNGISGNDSNKNLFSHSTQFEPKKDRTPVTDVIKELEERKKSKNTSTKRIPGPKKKLITDDFGEPIRWVWEDE